MTSAPAPPLDALDEFLDSDAGKGFEYVNGCLKEMPVSSEAEETTMLFGHAVTGHAIATGLGSTFGQNQGVRIWSAPKETRKADVVYVRRENKPPPGTTFLTTPPDLVVEVVSLHDKSRDVRDKVTAWLEGGVTMVWVAYPFSSEVHVFRRGAHPLFLTADDELDGDDVLTGFRARVATLFPTPTDA